jgi:hypothetical protein
MLGMMGNGNKERGAMMGNHRAQAMAYVMSQLGGCEPHGTIPTSEPSPSNLKDAGGAVMRALQSGDVEAFTASLARFIETMDELTEDPFDLEVE